jgi:hypothetical protein
MIPWKWLAYLLSSLFAIFLGFQVISIMMGNSLIDYKFYAHINFGMAADSTGFFIKQVLFGVLMLFLVMFSYHKVVSKPIKKTKQWILGGLILFSCSIFLMMPKGVFYNLKEIQSIHFAKKQQFNKALESLGIEDYTKKNALKVSGGENIVVIALESVEAAFLKDNLAKLTPNLRKLKEDFNFHRMMQIEGASYTIGAQYTYLTGIPMYFKNHGNDVFQNTYNSNIVTIADVLLKGGYDLKYLMGNPGFTGADNMLKIMGFDVRSEEQYPQYKINTWGLHDLDLFKIARSELDSLYDTEDKFAYFISTISTHSDDGVFDSRIAQEFPTQKSQLELMVNAVDDHVNDLVEFILSKDPNTAIYILPDHRLMGSLARILTDFEHPRDLFLMSNKESPSYPNGQMINQVDVPKLILEGAQVEHNMSFLTDVIKGDKKQFVEKNKTKILQLNEASVIRDNSVKKEEVVKEFDTELNEDEIYCLSNAWMEGNQGSKSLIAVDTSRFQVSRGVNVLSYVNETYSVRSFDTFQSDSTVVELLTFLKKLRKQNDSHYLLVHDTAGKEIKNHKEAFMKLGFHKLGHLDNHRSYIAEVVDGFVSERQGYRMLEIRMLKSSALSIRNDEEIIEQAKDPNRFIAHAGGAIDGRTYTNCKEALDLSYKNGFRLFELDIIKTKDGQFVAAHDWNQWRDKNGFAGKVPVDLKTFLSTKIEKHYTPMDMKAINQWFGDHKDAILVTDKVREAKQFIEQFIDKDRLMMELFSFEAMDEAIALGIKEAILTEARYDYLGDDKLKGLKDRGYTAMAVSIRTILKKKEFYKKAKAAGIKIYAFHIGSDEMIDEGFMARIGLDLCYGLYADYWLFNN